MTSQAQMNCDNLDERKALFESLGGLPDVTVTNTEWLYMLKEDTRQSLAIEGYFASEEELKAVLQGDRTGLRIANYFRTAQTVYDQGLQFYRDKSLQLPLALIRHIHSELFRELDRKRGEFREDGSSITIRGARIRPPDANVVEYVRSAIQVIQNVLAQKPILQALAQAHTLFESIHPFHDGNGRAGRILLNYLAISKGYPPIVIKGTHEQERKQYYEALEAGDKGFHGGFPDPDPVALQAHLERGDFGPLSLLLCEGMIPRLDHLIILALEANEALLPLAEVATQLGVKEPALRKRIQRGRLLASKRGKRLFSHPRLAL